MAESQPIKISTSKYTKQGKVDIDDNIWDVVMPGAGTELRFSQASRASKLYGARISILDKKIDNGTITEEELDKYEEYSKIYDENERIVLSIIHATYKDGTKDNNSVKKWVEDTPLFSIMKAFEEARDQANATEYSKQSGTESS